MQNASPLRAMLGGFLATLVMTILMYSGPMMGMPKMDIAAMLGSMFNDWQMPAAYSNLWVLGMVIHFINGTIIFPLIFAYLLYAILPGSPAVKGMEWGLTLWFVAQAVVMPFMGMGFFAANAPQPFMSVMGSLLGHIVYGLILGVIAGPQATAVQVSRQVRVETTA